MPTFVKGNLWGQRHAVDLLLFTSNSTLDSRKHLVMGAGSAAEAKRWYPWFPVRAGKALQETERVGKIYGLWIESILEPDHNGHLVWQRIGAFQTKRHWRDAATLCLIAHSIGMLCGLIQCHPARYRSVAMPFPGIGQGGVPRHLVLPLLDPLPALVQIYEPCP